VKNETSEPKHTAIVRAVEDYILAIKRAGEYEAHRLQARELRLPSLVTSESELRIADLAMKADEAAAAARAKAITLGREFSELPEVAAIMELLTDRPNFALLESLWPACRVALERSKPAALAARPVEPKQKPARGETESACVTCLMKHPHWTNQQIADHLKINPAGITRDRMPQFYRARDAIAGSSDDLPRGRKAKRGRNASDDQEIEAEYRKDGGCNAKTDDD
jgi:hypothetical protein